MKAFIGQLLVAGLLVATSTTFWIASGWEFRLAHADEAFATLNSGASVSEYRALEASLTLARRLPWFDGLMADVREHRAIAQYWASNEVEADDDPEVMFAVANAAYRTSVSGRDRLVMLRGLDDVMKQYLEVMKGNPDHIDAAYNYEYVARLRTALGNVTDTSTVNRSSRAESIGRRGTSPTEPSMKRFNMFVPQRPDERGGRGGVGGNKGGRKARKG